MTFVGEFDVDVAQSPYSDFGPEDWAVHFIYCYGGIDGAHHKDWVMDQVVRVLKGTPILLSVAKWDNGHEEYRFKTGDPSQEYLDWVEAIEEDCGGYDLGCPP